MFVWSFILGLLVGSFLNVCVYRLPRKQSIAKGRSYCPSCGHTLAALDLIPIISFLFLGRRCRYCRHPISWRYPLVELWCAVFTAFMLSFRPLQLFERNARFPRASSSIEILMVEVLLSLLFLYILVVWSLILFDGEKIPRSLYFWMGALTLLLSVFHSQNLFFQSLATVAVLIFRLIVATRWQLLRGPDLKGELWGLCTVTWLGGGITALTVLLALLTSIVVSRLKTTASLRSSFAQAKRCDIFIRKAPFLVAFIHTIHWAVPLL